MTNFYQQLKTNTKTKVKEKKKSAVTASAPITAGPGVYNVNGINVQRGTKSELMPTWVQGGHTYHINLRDGDHYHVTREGVPKIQFFFEGTGDSIVGVQPTKAERGKSKKNLDGEEVRTKRSFDELPDAVQDFVRDHWSQILG